MKIHAIDNGFCRIYYKEGKALYCLQEAGYGMFEFFVCSRDGEPDRPIQRDLTTLEVPTGDTRIEESAKDFLKGQHQ